MSEGFIAKVAIGALFWGVVALVVWLVTGRKKHEQ